MYLRLLSNNIFNGSFTLAVFLQKIIGLFIFVLAIRLESVYILDYILTPTRQLPTR